MIPSYAADVFSTDHAQYLADAVRAAGGTAEVVTVRGVVQVQMDARAYSILRDLDEESDGHIDPDQVMWIGGTPYPLRALIIL